MKFILLKFLILKGTLDTCVPEINQFQVLLSFPVNLKKIGKNYEVLYFIKFFKKGRDIKIYLKFKK